MDNIIQWNCRGLKANSDEIRLLASELKTSIFCLQETLLKPSDNFTVRNFHIYTTYGTNVHDRASGGSTILVRHGIIHSQIKLNSTLQATAVRLTLHKTITICSLYLPPNAQITIQDLNNLYKQLPSPSIILGDFNGHSPLWGSDDQNERGDVIEDFINKNNLCIYNNGTNTFFHSGHRTYSAIDLTISDPDLFLDYEWKVLEDTHGSDHFPILLRSLETNPNSYPTRWKFNKADWDYFSHLCHEHISQTIYNTDNPVESFTEDLINIANKSIPKSQANPHHVPKPWFDTEVKEAIKARKKALRQLRMSPTMANVNQFKILRAKGRRTIRQKK